MQIFASLDSMVGQWLLPTKSETEIKLNQQAREAKAADNVAEAYERLSERDETKVITGMTMFQKILSGNISKENKNEQQENHSGKPPKEQH